MYWRLALSFCASFVSGLVCGDEPNERPQQELSARIGILIRQLGDKSFRERDSAQRALVEIGERALSQLADARRTEGREIRTRVTTVIVKIEETAIAVLEAAGATVTCNGDGIAENFTLDVPRAEWKRPDLLRYIRGLHHLTNVSLSGSQATDLDLANVKHIMSLRRLALHDTHITDVGLAHLAQLRDLEDIHLDGTPITGRGFRHLTHLVKLKNVGLSRTSINDEGFHGICHALENAAELVSIPLTCCSCLTDAGLRDISKLSHLTGLQLECTAVTDSGLQHVAVLPRVKRLRLYGSNVTENGLRYVRTMKQLEFVSLSYHEQFDFSTLDILKDVPSLSVGIMVMGDTKLPDDTRRRFESLRPRVGVSFLPACPK